MLIDLIAKGDADLCITTRALVEGNGPVLDAASVLTRQGFAPLSAAGS